MEERKEKWALIGLFVLVFGFFLFLPSVGLTVYASPDETAVSFTTSQIAKHQQAFFPETLPEGFSWMHPRSFVGVSQGMASVGFLGWPWILSFLLLLLPLWILPIVASAIIASSVWPLYRLLRPYGFGPAWGGTLVAFFTPNVLLYGNRSLFPNGALMAFALWSLWLIVVLKQKKEASAKLFRGAFFVLGILCAMAAAIRPTELAWLAPWWMWAWGGMRLTKKEWKEFFLGIVLVGIPLMWLAHAAYGSVTFGYFVREATPLSERVLVHSAVSSVTRSTLPFGFHPIHIIKNVWAFSRLGWPWILASLGGLWMLFQDQRRASQQKHKGTALLLGLWTVVFLLVVYGSGWYTDRIGSWAPTVGNSFLRYLLPLSPLFGWLFAYAWNSLSRVSADSVVRSNRVKKGMLLCACVLAIFGWYSAFIRDDEGVLVTRHELVRYASIREAARGWFSSEAIIFSDRSDKIFFPLFRAVSPLPSLERMSRLAHEIHAPLGYFGRPFSQAEKDAWSAAGLEAQELASFGREKLYRLRVRSL